MPKSFSSIGAPYQKTKTSLAPALAGERAGVRGRCRLWYVGLMNDYIEINPEVMVGKPVIKGTRITVELIMELTASGMSVDEIVSEYSHLTPDGVLAARKFAEAGNYLGPSPEFYERLRRPPE
jgi:uncharacterized protein (DUF433 family)